VLRFTSFDRGYRNDDEHRYLSHRETPVIRGNNAEGDGEPTGSPGSTESKKEKHMLQNRKAFTLLELIVVIVVAGILAGIAVPSFNAIKDRSAKEAAYQEAVAFAKNVTGLAAFNDPADVLEADITAALAESDGITGVSTTDLTGSVTANGKTFNLTFTESGAQWSITKADVVAAS
jgi:prepilin-type N-terminal cleavage/methylation domain-containing protein